MSATAESVQQSAQTSTAAQSVPNANLQGGPVVQPTLTTESTFQDLVDKGALDLEKKVDPKADAKPKREAKAPVQQEKEKPNEELAPKLTETDELKAAQDHENPAEAEEDEHQGFDSLDHYLTDQGLDRETFMDLPVSVKVDGKTQQVTLKDMVNSYQFQSYNNQKSETLSNERKSFEEQRTQVSQAMVTQVQQAQDILSIAEKTLLTEYQGIDWQTLNQQDPARYAALHIDYQNKLAGIKGQLAEIDRTRQTQQQQAESANAKRLPEEFEKLLGAIPEWRDPVKLKAGQEQILKFGKSMGLNEAELTLSDSRYVRILHMAALQAAHQAAKPETLKKVRAAPIMPKPGARTDRDGGALANQAAMENWRRNPRSEDAAAAVFDRLSS